MTRRTLLSAALGAPALVRGTTKPVNLLVIMTDQQRFSALSCAGNSILKTPNLDRLASEGAIFENAITPCPVCVPARTSILTGKSMQGTGVTGNAAATDTVLDCGPSFDNVLAAAGYNTEYHGKYHSPYKLASTYKNKVPYAGAKVEGAPSEHRQYLDYLDQHVPKRPLRPGEVLSKDFQRPYIPALLDGHITDPGEEPGQGEVYGWLQIPKEHAHAAFTVDETIDALDRMAAGPFSLTCSIGPPHPPFLNVAPYWGMYPAKDMPLPENFQHDMTWSPYRNRQAQMKKYQSPEAIREGLSIYYGMVREADDNIGRLLARLDALGLRDNTLVIFTSDHGEMMGSHGMGSKMTFYEESVHVPLLMRLPGRIKAGTRIAAPVSTMDLFATILDYLEVKAPRTESASLRPLLEGSGASLADFRVSEWFGAQVPNFMVRTKDWKLILGAGAANRSQDALFDLKNDPGEVTNLIGAPALRAKNQGRAGELRDRLVQWLEKNGNPAARTVRSRPLG